MIRLLGGQGSFRGRSMGSLELNTINGDTDLQVSPICATTCKSYLVLQIIPEVGPGLFDTSFLLDDGLLDDTSQNTESHGNSMIIVAVNRCSSL